MIKVNTIMNTFIEDPTNFWSNLFFLELNVMMLRYNILNLGWEVLNEKHIKFAGAGFIEAYVKDMNKIHKQYFIRRNMKYWLPFWYSRVECASYLELIDEGDHAMYVHCMVDWIDTEFIHTKVQLMNLKRL